MIGAAVVVVAGFLVVAMLHFPRTACDKMTAVCLAFIHRTGKGGDAAQMAGPKRLLVSL